MKLIKRKIKPVESVKPKITIALVVFDGNHTEYGFKTILPVKIGDTVIAQVGVNKNLKFVKVVKTNTRKDKNIKYKWLIGIVDKQVMLATHLETLKEHGIDE